MFNNIQAHYKAVIIINLILSFVSNRCCFKHFYCYTVGKKLFYIIIINNYQWKRFNLDWYI